MIIDSTRIAERLVGLGKIRILGLDDHVGEPLRVHIETATGRPACPGDCRGEVVVKDRDIVELVDLPVFGRPARLVWHKRRWRCPNPGCLMLSWTEQAPEIASPRVSMTARAARWVTLAVGRSGRAVSDVAAELGSAWHTINDTVVAYGEALLAADVDRVGAVTALGLDETFFVRAGRYRAKTWATSIVDVAGGRLLDIVEGRTAAAPSKWLNDQGEEWLTQIRWATLDMSGPYRKTFNDVVPDATQVADPFHLVKLATTKVNDVRRRVQQEALGHRGYKNDPLYRTRRLLQMADERLDDDTRTRLVGLLDAGDPRGELRAAWHAKEVVRSIYDHTNAEVALEFVTRLGSDLQDESCPPEIDQLGRTITVWRRQIAAWHEAHVSNGPTEAVNNLIKRVKRVGFGFTNWRNYRTRVLLYTGGINWDLLPAVEPR